MPDAHTLLFSSSTSRMGSITGSPPKPMSGMKLSV